jgi:hypothetical protein
LNPGFDVLPGEALKGKGNRLVRTKGLSVKISSLFFLI